MRDCAAGAGLLLHELAHQRVWAAGDAVFNESYASTVAPEVRCAFVSAEQRRAQWRALTRGARGKLAQVHASK